MKQIFLLLLAILMGLLAWVYFNPAQTTQDVTSTQEENESKVSSYKGDFNKPQGLQEFDTFLKRHNEKRVALSLDLTEDMTKDLTQELGKSESLLFATIPNPDSPDKNIYYVIKQHEDGSKGFIFDEKNKKLEGLFVTDTLVSPEGETFIYLRPQDN